jgi:hypothetical protein
VAFEVNIDFPASSSLVFAEDDKCPGYWLLRYSERIGNQLHSIQLYVEKQLTPDLIFSAVKHCTLNLRAMVAADDN